MDGRQNGQIVINYDKDWTGVTEHEMVFSLPHSCDEWVIGDVEDMKNFIKLCQNKLAEVIGES